MTRKLFGEGVSIEVEPKLMSEGEHLLQCGVKKGGRPEVKTGSLHRYVRMYGMYVCMYVCMYVRMYVCMYVCMYV